MTRTFTYPKGVISFTRLISIPGLVVSVSAPVLDGPNFMSLTVCLLMLGLITVVNLYLTRTRVILDDDGIIYQGLTGSVKLKWSEVDDFYSSPRSITVTSIRQRKRIYIFSGQLGFSFEPFEILQEEVAKHAGRRLAQMWAQLELPINVNYPGLRLGTVIAYLLTACFTLYVFILFLTKLEGLLFEKVLFLFFGLLILVPFFVRDYRRNRKQLIIEREGLRQRNGEEVFIPWQAIVDIDVRELTAGYSPSIVIESREGKALKIPRSLMNCGQVLYLIRRNTGLLET